MALLMKQSASSMDLKEGREAFVWSSLEAWGGLLLRGGHETASSSSPSIQTTPSDLGSIGKGGGKEGGECRDAGEKESGFITNLRGRGGESVVV